MHKSTTHVAVIIPNWNGVDELKGCLDSVQSQTTSPHIIVVDNGSTDESVAFVTTNYPAVELVRHSKNLGYAGGVNSGFRRAIELKMEYAAPFNNDAVADKQWLEYLIKYLDTHDSCGIAAPKLLSADGSHIDSTGDQYTTWGLPYPRGRDESNVDAYDKSPDILGASGGASLYRMRMLAEVGLFDEDFFAYYEDVDLSMRAQLAGWKIAYVPQAVAYHQTSTTGKKIKGFFTLQTLKNYPWIIIKNVPPSLLWYVVPRFLLAQTLFIGRAVLRGHAWWVIKALALSLVLGPKKLRERHRIQSRRKVSVTYMWNMMTHDLPPNAYALRRLRATWWQLTGRKS